MLVLSMRKQRKQVSIQQRKEWPVPLRVTLLGWCGLRLADQQVQNEAEVSQEQSCLKQAVVSQR